MSSFPVEPHNAGPYLLQQGSKKTDDATDRLVGQTDSDGKPQDKSDGVDWHS